MTKLYPSTHEALHDLLHDNMTIAVGGFGLSGVPVGLIEAVRDSGTTNLTIISNNMGVDGKGLGVLLEHDQVSKVVASYIGENRLFAAQYLSGRLEVEFVPQGTLAERLRAGGAGIPAFYTKCGVGTDISVGKVLAEFDGDTYVQERGLTADLALVRAHAADPQGNLIFRYTARNFNPVVATAAPITVAEVERHLALGELHPDVVVTPGIYVQRIVLADKRPKDIEQRTVRPTPSQLPREVGGPHGLDT